MRLFIGIDIPDDMKERLELFLNDLRPLAKLSWSPVQNMHITTKFIGEWPEERLSEMKNSLAGIPKLGAFVLQVKGLGWFPDERHARVFWAGVMAGDPMRLLAGATDGVTGDLGVPREKRDFSPHLTLARIREAVPRDVLRKALENVPADFGSFPASNFFLYLSRSGEYTKLAEFSLE